MSQSAPAAFVDQFRDTFSVVCRNSHVQLRFETYRTQDNRGMNIHAHEGVRGIWKKVSTPDGASTSQLVNEAVVAANDLASKVNDWDCRKIGDPSRVVEDVYEDWEQGRKVRKRRFAKGSKYGTGSLNGMTDQEIECWKGLKDGPWARGDFDTSDGDRIEREMEETRRIEREIRAEQERLSREAELEEIARRKQAIIDAENDRVRQKQDFYENAGDFGAF